MSTLPPRAGRRCHNALNPLHATVYFSPDLRTELGKLGIDDESAAYFAARAAALGAVGAGAVTATFYNFNHELVARHVPAVWSVASPQAVLDARLRAADATLRRVLGEEIIASPELAEAAGLALRATEACTRHAKPLYAAHADLPVPQEPHLAYWHAAALLRCCANIVATPTSPRYWPPVSTRSRPWSATRRPVRAWRPAGSSPPAAGAAPTGTQRWNGCAGADCWTPSAS